MSYTITNLRTDLENSLHGTTLNKVSGVNQIIQRAGSQLLLEVDPIETIRIVQMTSPIYNSVYDYAIPTDLKGTKIIDIRPQQNRLPSDLYTHEYNQAFDLGKQTTLQPNFTIQFNQGLKSMRIENNLLVNGILLNQADTITGNGTWIASGGATNLVQDNLFFVGNASSSLSFDTLSGHSNATLTNSTMEAQDLTDQYLQSHQFLFSYLPTASKFTSIELRFGSSASDYYTETFTINQDGTSFIDGWNLVDGNWATATKVGSPDITDIDYIQVIWTYDSTVISGVKLNSIYSRLGALIQIEYYSKYLFRDSSTGAFQETITDNSNIINLDTETRNLLYLLSGVYAVQQIQGLDALFFDSNFFEEKYNRALQFYKANFKSQWQKPRTTYYSMPNPSNKRWMGGRYF